MGEGAIGSLDYTSEERKILAKKSLSYSCTVCKLDNATALPVLTEKSQDISAEAKNLASQIEFKNKKQETTSESSTSPTDNNPESEQTIPVSQNEITRRVVFNENSESSSSSHIDNRPSINATNATNRSRQTETSESSLFLFTVSILSAVFLFLLIRRVYLLVDAPFPV